MRKSVFSQFTRKNLITFIFIFILSNSFSFSFPQQSKLSKAVNNLSSFMASNSFKKLRLKNNDLALADTIYVRALKYDNYNYQEALFDLTFAVIPYNKVHVEIPLLDAIVVYRLPSAPENIYLLKNKNLPKQLFFDTPQNNFGDKDKLAHFFGSAFISYSSNIFDLGNLIGYFIEVFEQDFEVQDSIDPRDLQTNKLGNIFGEILKHNKNIMPSEVMLIRSLIFFRYQL
ncbi:MAG: hypothetical protein ACYDA4_06955 [Ignavibacteriaceae bacterium]